MVAEENYRRIEWSTVNKRRNCPKMSWVRYAGEFSVLCLFNNNGDKNVLIFKLLKTSSPRNF